MSRLFSLSPEQLEIIRPYFPLSHGAPRVDDLRVISGSFMSSRTAFNGKTLPANIPITAFHFSSNEWKKTIL